MTSLADFPTYSLPAGQVAIGEHVNGNGHVVIASAEKPQGATGRVTMGGVLVVSAGLLLLALAVAMGVVSWHAQYAFIYRDQAPGARRRPRGARPGLRRSRVQHPGPRPGPPRPPRRHRARACLHLRGRIHGDERGRLRPRLSPLRVRVRDAPAPVRDHQ